MAFHPEDHIQVSYAQDQAGLRLLELPPELLELIESGHDVSLSMKSPPTISSSGAATPGGHVVLCTQNKTYELRQVQTSNTVMVLRPLKVRADNGEEPLEGVEAFATCNSTLEILPLQTTEKSKSPAQWLQELLPVWLGVPVGVGHSARSKHDYFAEVPYSNDEIEKAWMFMTVFEEDGSCFRPTERSLLDFWHELRRCIDVTGEIDVQQLFSIMRDSDYPRGLIETIVNRLSISSDINNKTRLDKDSTLQWLAVNAIAAKTGAQQAPSWSQLVPPEWLEDDPEGQLSQCAARAVEQAGAAPPEIVKAAQTKEAAKGSKRIGKSTNWHERFKRPKK